MLHLPLQSILALGWRCQTVRLSKVARITRMLSTGQRWGESRRSLMYVNEECGPEKPRSQAGHVRLWEDGLWWWEGREEWGQVDSFESKMLIFIGLSKMWIFNQLTKKLINCICFVSLSPSFQFHFLVIKLPKAKIFLIHSYIHSLNKYLFCLPLLIFRHFDRYRGYQN